MKNIHLIIAAILTAAIAIAGDYPLVWVNNAQTGKQDRTLNGKRIYSDISAVKKHLTNESTARRGLDTRFTQFTTIDRVTAARMTRESSARQSHSIRTDNPHNTTAAQVGAVSSAKFTNNSTYTAGHIRSVVPAGGHPAAGSNKQFQLNVSGGFSGASFLNGTGDMVRVGDSSKTPSSVLTVIKDLASTAVNYVVRIVNNVATAFARVGISFDFSGGNVATIEAVKDTNNAYLVFRNMSSTITEQAKPMVAYFSGRSAYDASRLPYFSTSWRSYLQNNGVQLWNLVNNDVQAGQIMYSTPGGNAGFAIYQGFFGNGFMSSINNGTSSSFVHGGAGNKYYKIPTFAIHSTGRVGINQTTSTDFGYTKPRAVFDVQSSARGRAITYTGSASNMVITDQNLGIRFKGKAIQWDDVTVPLSSGKAPASSSPTWTSYKSSEMPSFSATATNQLFFSIQLPHGYQEGANISCHIHVAYATNNGGNSRWQLTHSWANVNTAFPAATTITSTFASPSTTDQHAIHDFGTLTGTGKTISSVILFSLARLGADAEDTHTGAIYGVSFDCHVPKDSIGSDTTTTKTATP